MSSSLTIEKTRYECGQLQNKAQHQQHLQQQHQRWQPRGAGGTDDQQFLRKTGLTVGKVDVMYYSRGGGAGSNSRCTNSTDSTLVPPIRQTASIFKQPVTLYKTQDSRVRVDPLKQHNSQGGGGGGTILDKPKQLLWEKRLEGLYAYEPDEGTKLEAMELPKILRTVGPNISEETVIQSVATALHVSGQPVTGQMGSRNALEKNPGVFLDPRQPLIQAVNVTDEDIRRQEERVIMARRKLQEALKYE